MYKFTFKLERQRDSSMVLEMSRQVAIRSIADAWALTLAKWSAAILLHENNLAFRTNGETCGLCRWHSYGTQCPIAATKQSHSFEDSGGCSNCWNTPYSVHNSNYLDAVAQLRAARAELKFLTKICPPEYLVEYTAVISKRGIVHVRQVLG